MNTLKTIHHIINPYNSDQSSESGLDDVQEVTVISMINAKTRFLQSPFCKDAEVRLYYVQMKDEICHMPENFTKLPDLRKSVLDYFTPTGLQRELPLLQDILDSVSILAPKRDDIVIYSNADIAVKPSFYSFVCKAGQDFESFVVNRRDVPKKDVSGSGYCKEDIDFLYSLEGKAHPGYDCFVMPYHIVEKVELGKVFLGYPPVGSILKKNIEKLSASFKLFDDVFQTFHLGEDLNWRKDTNANHEYYEANLAFASELGYSFRKLKLLM